MLVRIAAVELRRHRRDARDADGNQWTKGSERSRWTLFETAAKNQFSNRAAGSVISMDRLINIDDHCAIGLHDPRLPASFAVRPKTKAGMHAAECVSHRAVVTRALHQYPPLADTFRQWG